MRGWKDVSKQPHEVRLETDVRGLLSARLISHIHFSLLMFSHWSFTVKVKCKNSPCEQFMGPSIASLNLFQSNRELTTGNCIFSTICSRYSCSFRNWKTCQYAVFLCWWVFDDVGKTLFHTNRTLRHLLKVFCRFENICLNEKWFGNLCWLIPFLSSRKHNHKTHFLTWVCWVQFKSSLPAGLSSAG